MDARLQQICAMVAAKPRSIDDIVLSLKTTKAMGSALVGRLAAVGVVKRDGAVVTAIDPEQAVAIANGTGDMPKRKRKKRKPHDRRA
jgi:hypothetical protein